MERFTRESDKKARLKKEAQTPQSVSIEKFANLVGFPEQLLKSELSLEDIEDDNTVSMDKLRAAMVGYLNSLEIQ